MASSNPCDFIALDLDGTCLTGDLFIHPRTIAAVAAAQSQGIPVLIATGRMYVSALPYAYECGITEPLICYQGAYVRTVPTQSDNGELLFDVPLPRDVAMTAIQCLRDGGWHRQLFGHDTLYCEEARPEVELYCARARVEAHYVDDLSLVVDDSCHKIVSVIDDDSELDRCVAALTETIGAAAHVWRTTKHYVEVSARGATKSAALRRLASLRGWDMERGIAMGDAPNDTDMVAAVGCGVAVESPWDEVRSVARITCSGPELAGVADVIEAVLGGDLTWGPEKAASARHISPRAPSPVR